MKKLERYFRNSEDFMWGLGQGNKGLTYEWLKRAGVTFITNKYTYEQVKEALLAQPSGIDMIINDIIIPRVRELFTKEKLDFLRGYWVAGHKPDITGLKQHSFKISNSLFYAYQEAYPFLVIRNQNRQPYVEKWGEFAGLWFEEIEPLQDEL